MYFVIGLSFTYVHCFLLWPILLAITTVYNILMYFYRLLMFIDIKTFVSEIEIFPFHLRYIVTIAARLLCINDAIDLLLYILMRRRTSLTITTLMFIKFNIVFNEIETQRDKQMLAIGQFQHIWCKLVEVELQSWQIVLQGRLCTFNCMQCLHHLQSVHSALGSHFVQENAEKICTVLNFMTTKISAAFCNGFVFLAMANGHHTL